MSIQSVCFDRQYFTTKEAKTWMVKRGIMEKDEFKPKKTNIIKFSLLEVEQEQNYFTVNIQKGVVFNIVDMWREQP